MCYLVLDRRDYLTGAALYWNAEKSNSMAATLAKRLRTVRGGTNKCSPLNLSKIYDRIYIELQGKEEVGGVF